MISSSFPLCLLFHFGGIGQIVVKNARLFEETRNFNQTITPRLYSASCLAIVMKRNGKGDIKFLFRGSCNFGGIARVWVSLMQICRFCGVLFFLLSLRHI